MRHTLFGGGNDEEQRGGPEEDTKTTFGFPIMDVIINVTMKNIPMASLPLFRGMSSKDLDALYLNLIFYAEVITNMTMHKKSNYSLPP